MGVDVPEDDALPELANDAPILYTKHDVVSLIARTLTRDEINAPAVAHGPLEIGGSAPGDGPRRARVGSQRAGVRAPDCLVDRGSSVRLPLVPPRVLRVVLASAEVHVCEAPAAYHLGMRVGRREAEEPAEEPRQKVDLTKVYGGGQEIPFKVPEGSTSPPGPARTHAD